MAQAKVAHLVCPSGKQFQNEAKEEKPERKDPSSPRSQGADEESSSWPRKRGGDSSQDTRPEPRSSGQDSGDEAR